MPQKNFIDSSAPRSDNSTMTSDRVHELPLILIHALENIVGSKNVMTRRSETLVYDCDGLTLHKALPGAVVFVSSTEEVSRVVKACCAANHPYLARGAGTGLSGGAAALNHAIVIEMARMNHILEINAVERYAIVEPGVINADVTKACSSYGLHFAPDPSSQNACTIGGNVAENSGGPHTLKHGVTTNHILGLEVVMPDGDVLTFGDPTRGAQGYDLAGLFTGSEGTFGIATKIWCKLTPNPEAVKTLLAIFPSIDSASRSVSGIIAAGIIPAALELIDKNIIRAVESWLHLGFPPDANAILLIELDGLRDGLEALAESVSAVCRKNGCLSVRSARDNSERLLLWKARKQAFGAIGRISPSFYVQDGVIPRTRLPEVLVKIEASGIKHGLQMANVFHAGDGNLHPLILFDERDPRQVARAMDCNIEVLEAVIAVGGMLSGEHGIGLEKLEFMPRVFSENDMDGMRKIRNVFDPLHLCNPGKVVPTRRCLEVKGRVAPSIPFGVRRAT